MARVIVDKVEHSRPKLKGGSAKTEVSITERYRTLAGPHRACPEWSWAPHYKIQATYHGP